MDRAGYFEQNKYAIVAIHVVRPKFYQFFTSTKNCNWLCIFMVENRKIVITNKNAIIIFLIEYRTSSTIKT